MNFITINEDLISEVTGYPPEDFASLQELNLHLSDDPQDRKIRKIEHLSILPNLRRLNLSYNAISKIEGLDRLVHLSELNLAENNINRIENLDYLKSLQKLNLSGNVIERIPATIRQLHQLNHLRITRNNLSHIEDIQHLAHLPYLTNLRIDENPLCDDPDYDLYITYHVPTLLFLNGREISDEMREAARLKFATSQRDLLVSKLDAEKHKLARLKRNLQRSSPVRRSSPAGTTRPNEEDEDDEEPQIMAQKLEEIELVAKEIDQLQELVHRFDRGQSPEIFRRSTDDFDRLKSNVATPMRSSHMQASSAPNSSFRTPQGDSLAAKQITELQDRIELLATKVLTTEKEKSTLKKELDAHRKSDNVVQRLTDELMITEESLEKALRAAKDAHEELDDVRGELTVTRGHLEESEGDVQRLTKENTALREDNQQLQRENRDLLRLVEDLEAKAAAKPPPPPPSWSAVDDWRAEQKQQRHHEDYATVLELQRINIHLQAELDRHLQESTTLTQHLMRSREETEQLKRTLVDYEARDRDARTEKHQLERTIQALQTERSNLQRTIGTLESNIKALESDLAAIIRAKNNTPMKPTSSSSLASSRRALATPKRTLKAATGGRPMTFLDAWSSESDVDQSQQLAEDVGGAAASESSRYLDRVHLSSSGRKTPRRGAATGAAPATMKFSLTELERSAAEIMAHIMLEELQQMQSSGSGSSGGGENKSKSPAAAAKRLVRPDDLKDACIRAALRLVYTSTNLVQDPELQRAMAEELDTSDPHHHSISNSNSNSAPHRRVKFTPFHALGDRHVLSKLVADTHAGLTAMEEAAMYRDDINQLEKLARELELRAENADRSIVEKDNILKGLQRHAEEAKRQAEETLHELDNLHKKLQQGRDEVVRLDNEQQMLKREVDIARGHMKDTTALSELEQRNLTSLRERVQDMKREQGTLESTLLGLRDQHAKEEAKVRAIRATSTEQLRLLQVDVSKLAHEFKAKQRAMEDLDKHRRAVEEETETKKRDTETLLSTLHREVEDEQRKLSAARNEQRYLRTEVESWHAKRKQAEADYALIHEKYTTEHSKYETEELDIRRKLDQGDRLLQEQERKGKTLREKCAALEQEQTALRHSVDELRRQQTDVERSLDTKRRTTEAELQQAQHSAQLANRSLRQLSTQLEQKQHEYEAMCAECRTQERRVEELKRLVREHEGRVEHQRELSKALELERVQATKELAQTKRDDEELRHQQLLMKNTVETEARAVEETRRRLLALTADVEHMQETETRGRQQLHTIQTELDAVQQELLACRAQQDRERRLLSELTAKRALLDAETHRQQESLRCVTERTHAEHHRTQEVEQSMLKSIEELNRAQKTLVQLEKKIDEAQRRAEETTQRETHVKQQIAKWQLEVDGLHALYTTEKRHVETVREEGRRLTSEQHRYQEELQALTLQTKEYRVEMETTQRFVEHQQAVKLALEQEIHRLQETNRWEQQRLATASEQYQSLEQHLQRLRHELEALQATYTKTKHETVEEARRTEQQRRLLQATLTDMMALETRMSEIKQGLARDKQRAMAEIGQLQQVKQNTEQQILLLGETQRRLDRHHQWNVQQHPPVVVPVNGVAPPSSSSLSSSSLWKTTETRLPSTERSRSRSRSQSQSPSRSRSRSRSRSPTGGASYLNVKTMTATPPVFTVTALPHRSSSSTAATATSSTAASLIPAATVAKEMYRLKVSLADDDRLHSDDSGDDVFQRRGRWVAHHQQQQQQQQRPVDHDHDHDEEEDTRPNQRSRSASACVSRRDSLDEYDDAHDAATTSASAAATAATGSRSVHFATRPTMTTALEDISDDFSVSSVDIDGGGERDSLGAWPTTTTATTATPFSFSSTLPADSGSPPSSASATNKDSLVTAASTGGGSNRGGVSGSGPSAFVSDEDADHHRDHSNDAADDDDEDDWSDSNAGRLSSLQEAIRQLREQSEAVLAQSSSGSSPSSGSGR